MSRLGTSPLAGATAFEIDPDQIEVGERVGFYYPDTAAAFGRLMAVHGQRDPIKVVKNPNAKSAYPWLLVTGLHRLRGAQMEGLPVLAFEVCGKADELIDLEVSENAHRRQLPPLERAKFTAMFVQVTNERVMAQAGNISQQKRAVMARWEKAQMFSADIKQALDDDTEDTCTNIGRVYGWEAAAVEALGLSRQTIYDDLELHRQLILPIGEHAAPLSQRAGVGNNATQLKKIARLPDVEHRRAVVAALLADVDLSVDGACEALGISPPKSAAGGEVGQTKFLKNAAGNLDRLSSASWQRWAPTFAKHIKPSALIAVRDAINAEIEARVSADQAQLKKESGNGKN